MFYLILARARICITIYPIFDFYFMIACNSEVKWRRCTPLQAGGACEARPIEDILNLGLREGKSITLLFACLKKKAPFPHAFSRSFTFYPGIELSNDALPVHFPLVSI